MTMEVLTAEQERVDGLLKEPKPKNTAKMPFTSLRGDQIARLNAVTIERAIASQRAKERPLCFKVTDTIVDDRKARQREALTSYDALTGRWLEYYRIAQKFEKRIPIDERDDFRHDLLVTLHDADNRKELTEGGMYRVAVCQVADHWRQHFELTNGLECGHCSTKQRELCHRRAIYSTLGQVCARAFKAESLNKPVVAPSGELTEYGEMVADDSIDIQGWCDAKMLLLDMPIRLLRLGWKIREGDTLNQADRQYLAKMRRRYSKQLSLF